MGKAKTQAEKKRAKRGRPKMEHALREENGRISRSGVVREPADVVALNARVRLHGIPIEQAKDQKAETFIGRLCMRGILSEAQYQALVDFLDVRDAYMRSIKAPNALLDNKVSGSSGDDVSDGYIEWAQTAVERYDDAKKVIQRLHDSSRRAIWPAIHICVVGDEKNDVLIPCIKLVANDLVVHFAGLTRRRKAG